MKNIRIFTFTAILCSVVSGCATIDSATGERKDPLEGFNRTMWNFNYNVVDPYLLKPLAKGWKEYVPTPIKAGLTNVANNLDEPASFVNRLLTGDFKKALIHFNRFWINSIFGLGGLIDVAGYREDLKVENNSRFGDTLGRYGVDTGSYVMLPFYGPATPRQDIGNLADLTYPVYSLLGPWSLLKYGIQGLDTRAKLLDKDALLTQSQDSYILFREAYFQNMEYRVKDGKTNAPKQTLSDDILKEID